MIPVHSNFRYHNGPVLVSPIIYSVFLGKFWSSDQGHFDRMGDLKQFLSDLPNSGFMNVLSQYGCGFGAGSAGKSLQSIVHTPAGDQGQAFVELPDTDLRQIIQNAIDEGLIAQPGTPTTVAVMVFLADNVFINDDPTQPPPHHLTCLSTTGAFGYHDSFTTKKGDLLPYAVVSSANDKCLNDVCSQPGRCPLSSSQKQIERQTMVTSHEFAEMLTNPSNGGWFDDREGPDPGDEIADICQHDVTDPTAFGQITVTRTWAVQKIYSVADAQAGRDPAVTSAPNPLPKLLVAPEPRRVPLSRFHQVDQVARILPLPDIRVDAVQDRIQHDERDTRAFLNRLFRPYRPQQVVGDLPRLLRHIADVIEKDN